MPSALKSLSELFNRRIYRIPDYQRGYAWESAQLEDFWDDLLRLGPDRAHYTGQVTLESVHKERWDRWGEEERWLLGDGWKAFYVVDGQQRLTTSIILLKTVLDRLKGKRTLGAESRDELVGRYLFRRQRLLQCPVFGYEKDNPSHEFFRSQILGIASNRGADTETKYTTNLQGAHDFFQDRLRSMKPHQVEDIFQKLTNRLRFNEYELEDDFDVFVAFETMNNRGKQLSKLELLKNRLIYISTLLPVDEAQQRQLRSNITDAWKTIYEFLGKDHQSPLDDDEFLRAHWILFFQYTREGAGDFHNFLLNERFTTRALEGNELTLESLQEYITSLQEAAAWWWAVHFPANADILAPSVRKAIERLQRLGYGAFEPLLLAVLLRRPAEKSVSDLVSQAERFIFVAARFSGIRGDTGNSHFYRLAGDVYREVRTVEEALASVREWADRHFNVERATVEMEERFTAEGGRGFYDWRELRFLLFEYEQHLKAMASSRTSKLNWYDFMDSRKDHATVEHIYPQSPIDGDWPEFERLGPDQQHRLRHSLGNLLALARPKNSELSNNSFRRKKRGVNGRGYAAGSFSEGEIAQEKCWTPKHILRRGLAILTFMEERWGVSLGDKSQRIRLLGLDFMNAGPRKRK